METERKCTGGVQVIERQTAELAFRFDGTERNGNITVIMPPTVVVTQSTQSILVYRLYHEMLVSLKFTHLYITFQQKLKLNRYGEQCICVCVHIHVTCTKCMPAAMHMIAIIIIAGNFHQFRHHSRW